MVTPVAFVGDIHGDARRLEKLLDEATRWDRLLVFLGDYVNRGPQSNRVLDAVSYAVSEGHIALLGNHDQAFLDYLEGRRGFVDFAMMGGAASIRSYLPRAEGDVLNELRQVVPREHLALLQGLEPSWESPWVLASHTGYDPNDRNGRDAEHVALQGHPEIFRDPAPPRSLVVCGHYTQHSRIPYVSERLVCLDTACGSGGPLSALLWPEREIIQV